jgi:hypothetical protein
MEIQVKLWNGIGDPDDPKTGTSMTQDAAFEALRGRVVASVSGVVPRTDTVTIGFTDETTAWFLVSKGVPRILLVKGGKGGKSP